MPEAVLRDYWAAVMWSIANEFAGLVVESTKKQKLDAQILVKHCWTAVLYSVRKNLAVQF